MEYRPKYLPSKKPPEKVSFSLVQSLKTRCLCYIGPLILLTVGQPLNPYTAFPMILACWLCITSFLMR